MSIRHLNILFTIFLVSIPFQNCHDKNCLNRGCSETKLLLAHVKVCPAGPGFPCPTRCKGCNETRKLLAHYRRCKDMRTKQVGLGRRTGMQPDQSCLVCSLMARYAKSMVDRAKPKNTGTFQRKSLLSSSLDGKFNVEKGLDSFNKSQVNSSPTIPRRTPSMTLMPPPPPRCRSIPSSSATAINMANESFPSPPDPSQFDSHNRGDPSLLGKRVDSKVRIPFPILRNASRKVVTVAGEVMVVPVDPAATTTRRKRTGSYDEWQTRVVKFAPSIITGKQYYLDEPNEEELPASQGDRYSPTRPRSASVGCNENNASSLKPRGYDSIAEDKAGKELFPVD